jgi:hypothetical protein
VKPDLYQELSLIHDIPEDNLRAGDVATLVDYVAHPSGGEEGAVLEVFNALGDSIAVVTVPASSIALLRADQLPTVRTFSHSTGFKA